MNDPVSRQNEAELERSARQAYESSLERLDAHTLSRLHQARNQAIEAAATARLRRPGWLVWVPAGALAAGVLSAALLVRTPVSDPALATGVAIPPAPVELLAAGDEDLDIAAEADLGFYEWMAVDSEPEDEVGG